MIHDLIVSFKDNIYQKAKNPFLATIILIWTFKNWRLVYGLFTFDDKATQQDKIAYIEKYFNEYPFYPILGQSIAYAFIVLISTYILLILSRFVVDFYDNIALPYIRKLTSKVSIVSREVYEQVKEDRDNFEEKYYAERTLKSEVQKERDEFEKEIRRLTNEADKVPALTEENESYKERISELDNYIMNAESRSEKLERRFAEEESSPEKYRELELRYDALSKELEYPEKPIVEKVIAELISKKLENKFLEIFQNLTGNTAFIKNDDSARLFVHLGMLKPSSEQQEYNGSDYSLFTITNLGREVRRLLELESGN